MRTVLSGPKVSRMEGHTVYGVGGCFGRILQYVCAYVQAMINTESTYVRCTCCINMQRIGFWVGTYVRMYVHVLSSMYVRMCTYVL